MFMAPATGRPSSSVAHGSAHTPPGAAATYSIMSELATPAEQCSAGTANRPQTLPVASDGTNNEPSSGCTSRRSACSYTAAGIASSATALPCADDRAPFLQPNAPSKEFTVQRQKKPHCLLPSSLCLEQTLPSSRSTAWVLREAANRCHLCKDPNVRKQRPHSLHHTSPLFRTRAVPWGSEARRTAHAQGHKQKQCHPRRTAR
ncbi:regulator of sigma E protease [Trypanosoma cruzi]|nr:regulator of sigma E protease [Trypanosoma cruzi]